MRELTSYYLFIGNLGANELLWVVLAVALLFGGGRVGNFLQHVGREIGGMKRGMERIRQELDETFPENLRRR